MDKNLMFELEQAQLLLAQNSGLLPSFVNTPWIPVERIKMTDDEIDLLVDEAESEFVAPSGKKPIITAAPKKKGRKGEKLNQTRVLFNSIKHLDRKEVIGRFISELNLSKGTANTYYYLLIKEV